MDLSVMGVRVGVALSEILRCAGISGIGRPNLWALEWAWPIAETNTQESQESACLV